MRPSSSAPHLAAQQDADGAEGAGEQQQGRRCGVKEEEEGGVEVDMVGGGGREGDRGKCELTESAKILWSLSSGGLHQL